jgi:hypothetical protein
MGSRVSSILPIRGDFANACSRCTVRMERDLVCKDLLLFQPRLKSYCSCLRDVGGLAARLPARLIRLCKVALRAIIGSGVRAWCRDVGQCKADQLWRMLPRPLACMWDLRFPCRVNGCEGIKGPEEPGDVNQTSSHPVCSWFPILRLPGMSCKRCLTCT